MSLFPQKHWPILLLASIASATLAAAQTPEPPAPADLPATESLPSPCTIGSFEAEGGATLSHFCTQLEQPGTWGLLREERVTYSKRGLVDSTLLEQAATPQAPDPPAKDTHAPGTHAPDPQAPTTQAPSSQAPEPQVPDLQVPDPQTKATQPAYKILLWPPDASHEYASEEPLLVLEPQLDPGTTLDPSGPQYLRLIPGQLLVYIPLLGPQRSLLYRVDLRAHRLLQTLTLPICPPTQTCVSQQLFLMAHGSSRSRWLLHTWRFGTGDQHQTTTLFWDGKSIVERAAPATLLGPTWVAVTLQDDRGRPSVREHYRVGLRRPAGWILEGCLDTQGDARPEDVFKGTVDISFPEESDRDWHVTRPPKKHGAGSKPEAD